MGGLSRRRAKIALGASVGLPLTAALLVGALHSRAARPYLGRLGVRKGCPVNMDAVTPASLENERLAAIPALRGEGSASARPAMGFQLARATRNEVRAWARNTNAACEERFEAAEMHCAGVPPTSSPRDVVFRFEPAGVLVAVDVMRRANTPEDAAHAIAETSSELAHEVGPPKATTGEATAAFLGAEPYRRATIQFRFRDYAADVSATNLAGRGIIVREQYRAIPD